MSIDVRFTAPAGPEDPDVPRMGAIAINGVEWSTVIPPLAGDLRAAYEQFLERGGIPDEPAPPVPAPPPRVVAMWRARTIMKVTPHGAGTLFDAVKTAIASLDNPLQKAAAEEALDRGDVFDRDGVFVPLLAQIVGIDESQLDALMEQATALPA